MFVYVDETGDTGFKFSQGSSRFFLVTMLLTSDPVPLNSEIEAFRRDNRFPVDHEFKFYRSPDSVRMRFLRLLLRHECLIRCLVVDKQQLTADYMRDKTIFYNYLVKMLLQHDNGRLQDAQLILDRRDQRKAKQGLAPYIRREVNRGGVKKIRDIKYHESHRDNLLQAVDMASGAIYAHYAKDRPEFLRLIRPRIDDIWTFTPYT